MNFAERRMFSVVCQKEREHRNSGTKKGVRNSRLVRRGRRYDTENKR